MDIKTLTELAKSDFPFFVLFILCVFIVGRWLVNFIKEQQAENNLRENKLIENYEKQLQSQADEKKELMIHLERSNDHLKMNTETLKEISTTQHEIQKNLYKLEVKVDESLKAVWVELASKQDK